MSVKKNQLSVHTFGFTLIELLIVITIIAIVAGAVLIAVNPVKRLAQAHDSQRWSEVQSIISAVSLYLTDNNGEVPDCGTDGDIPADGQYRCIGTGSRPKPPGFCIIQEQLCQPEDGCCYNSLADWEAGWSGLPNANLVQQEVIAVAKIIGTWSNPDTDLVNFGPEWTTNEDYYIKIYTDSTARHQGIWDDSQYYRLAGANNGYMISAFIKNIKIEGLQVYNSNLSGVNAGGIYYGDQNTIEISHNIIRGNPANVNARGIGISGSGTQKIWNNIIYNWARGISNFNPTDDVTAVIYNNTFFNCATGVFLFSFNSAAYIKNNLLQAIPTNFSLLASDINGSDNRCESALCELSLGLQGTVDFIDRLADPPDLHLDPTDNVARNAGLDLSIDPDGLLSFENDMDLGSRPAGVSWDIGADEESVTGTIVETDQCCDLEESLIPTYFSSLPEDPTAAETGYTGYEIKRQASGQFWIWAPHKQNEENEIEISK